jgi:hypothetical protein
MQNGCGPTKTRPARGKEGRSGRPAAPDTARWLAARKTSKSPRNRVRPDEVRVATAKVTRDRCHGSSTADKHHLMQMSFVLVYFIAFSLLAFVVGPALRIEDRPAFKRPDKKARWLF